MTDLERRLCWYEVRADIGMRHEDDWPASLPVLSIAWLKNQSRKDGYNAFLSILKSEIATGRLPQNGEPLTITKTSSERVFMGISLTHGGAERWENVSRTKTETISTVRAEDAARLLNGMKIGKHLDAWLSPYRQPATPELPQEIGGRTKMRRAAIISQLCRRYPSLEADFNRPEAWIKNASTGRHGWYYFELIEEGCRNKWGAASGNAPLASAAKVHKLR